VAFKLEERMPLIHQTIAEWRRSPSYLYEFKVAYIKLEIS
jgi:hypothetical protein